MTTLRGAEPALVDALLPRAPFGTAREWGARALRSATCRTSGSHISGISSKAGCSRGAPRHVP